jgi:hypothetical protein
MSANQPPPGGGKVPLVSEVVDRLSKALGPSAPKRAAMFQAALQVCSDELRRVKKEGGEPASLQELVKRASEILGSPIGKPPDVGAAFQGDLSPLLDQTFGPMADKSEETPTCRRRFPSQSAMRPRHHRLGATSQNRSSSSR